MKCCSWWRRAKGALRPLRLNYRYRQTLGLRAEIEAFSFKLILLYLHRSNMSHLLVWHLIICLQNLNYRSDVYIIYYNIIKIFIFVVVIWFDVYLHVFELLISMFQYKLAVILWCRFAEYYRYGWAVIFCRAKYVLLVTNFKQSWKIW